MGGSGRISLPTSSHLGQSGGEVAGLPVQENHSDCSRMAQHALVLGSMSRQIPLSLHELRPLKEDQPDQSMRQSRPFLQSGASLIRRTSGHPSKVNNRLPTFLVSSQEATAKYHGKLGNSSINVSKDENLTCLLDSFQRDRPKGRRGHPLLEPLPGFTSADKDSF